MSSQETKEADLAKVIVTPLLSQERQNVISYKKKPHPSKGKDSMKSQNNDDQDTVSAQSLQSGVYSEDVSRLKGKPNPLPQLSQEKKRFIAKNLLTQELRVNNFQQKQVRQHDNLMLKQKNNFLVSQNMKLKTKVTTLERQNTKLQKMLEEQPSNSSKSRTPGLVAANINRDHRFRQNDNLSTKILLKNLKKELQECKKQNNNIKSSIKFTTITELEFERDAILEETSRLRAMLQEQQTRRISMKANQQGYSHMEHRLGTLQDRNNILTRENHELNNKLKKLEENLSKQGKSSENEKNLNKMLFNTRRSLKEKEKELQDLRDQIKSTSGSITSVNNLISDKGIPSSTGASNIRRPSVEKSKPVTRNFDRRVVSKSANKIKPAGGSDKSLVQSGGGKCQNCQKLETQNKTLKKNVHELEELLEGMNPGKLSTDPIKVPTTEETDEVVRFLQYRFKAHHLSLEDSKKYLLKTENITEEELASEMTLEQMVGVSVSEPFLLLNKRYMEVFLMKIFYAKQSGDAKVKDIKLDKEKKMKKSQIIEAYLKLVPEFKIVPQETEEEMFLQTAELITAYNQQILNALSNRQNGEGTVSQKDFVEFLTDIELEKEFLDFMITQIILESVDLQRLNFYTLFEIFLMPAQEMEELQKQVAPQNVTVADKKKRFEVDQVVKEEDEEYEQSRSYVDNSRQKTLSKKDQSVRDEEGSHIYDENQESQSPGKSIKSPGKSEELQKPGKGLSGLNENPSKQAVSNVKVEEDYEEAFQEEKMNEDNEEEKKSDHPGNKLIEKPYEIEDIADQYEEEFDS